MVEMNRGEKGKRAERDRGKGGKKSEEKEE